MSWLSWAVKYRFGLEILSISIVGKWLDVWDKLKLGNEWQ